MQKRTKFVVISVMGFILSALFTIQLFVSNATGKYEKLMMILAAIVFECSKWILLWEGFSGKHSGALKTTLVTLWLAVTVGSVVASCGYVLNQSNKVSNIALVSSTEYKQAEQARNAKLQNFQLKQTEIEQLKQQASELPKNYYSMKQQIMEKVTAKSKELSTISEQLQQPIKVSPTLTENGYTAFFLMMGKILDEDSKLLELWFFMIIGIILEAIANVFAYLSQKETNINLRLKPSIVETCEPTAIQEKQPIKFQIKKQEKLAKVIGFKPEPKKTEVCESTAFDEDEFKTYTTYMYNRAKNGYAPGYIDIARNTNLAVEKCRSIKGELQRRGIIKTEGNRTRIIKEVV